MRPYEQCLREIAPLHRDSMLAAQKRWDSVGKPLGALGLLEENIVRMAGIFGREDFSLSRRCVVVFCADHGVVCEGVSQCGAEVTAAVAANMARGRASVCRMARLAGAEVLPVDIGMAEELRLPGLLQRCVARGTQNLRLCPAMTEAQALQAIEVGIELAEQLAREGVQLLAMGEMGIGNTTSSAGLLSVLLNRPVAEVTGRGAGLSSEGLRRKIRVLEEAIALHRPSAEEPLALLCALGGLELAGLVGLCLGGARCRVPVLLDGLISSAAALLAVRLCPGVRDFLFASHCSSEPAAAPALRALGLQPLLYAGMHLGEGTGAVAVLPLLDMALEIYHGDTFDALAVKAYQPLL